MKKDRSSASAETPDAPEQEALETPASEVNTPDSETPEQQVETPDTPSGDAATTTISVAELEELRARAAAAGQASADASDAVEARIESMISVATSEGRALPAHEPLIREFAAENLDFVDRFLAMIPKGSVSPVGAPPVTPKADSREGNDEDLIESLLESNRQASSRPNVLSRVRA